MLESLEFEEELEEELELDEEVELEELEDELLEEDESLSELPQAVAATATEAIIIATNTFFNVFIIFLLSTK